MTVQRERLLRAVFKLILVLSPLQSYAAPFHPWVIAADGGHSHEVQPGSSACQFTCRSVVLMMTVYIKLLVSVALVLSGGVFAGLTLGLMGLDMVNLRVLSVSGSELEKKQAVTVLSLLDKGRHWVLVVLLLSNVVVNESLPIFLDSILGGGVGAVILSTAMIVIFGEIIPQSICVRHGLAIGSKSAPFVLALMYAEWPIAYPIAKLLDYVLGEDQGTTYKKAELKTFVGLHQQLGTELLDEDEVTIISSVLELSEKAIESIMTPITDVYALSSEQVLDAATIAEISDNGYSRVPVYRKERDNFIGMLLVKKLISYDPDDQKPVKDFPLSVLPEASPDMNCLQALNFFQEGRSHILLISTNPGEAGGAIGVVTLEDVIEEIIGEEIIDETDIFVDVSAKVRVTRKPPLTRMGTRGVAPLLKDAIERRKVSKAQPQHVHENADESTSYDTFITDQPVTSKLVKAKGGLPQKKSSLLVMRRPSVNTPSSSRRGSFATETVILPVPTESEPLLKKVHQDAVRAAAEAKAKKEDAEP